MSEPLLTRLRDYYIQNAKSLLAISKAASIYANYTDKGLSREKLYYDFLTSHLPWKCKVFFGGALFDDNGQESKQLDIIITTDTSPRWDLHNRDSSGKILCSWRVPWG